MSRSLEFQEPDFHSLHSDIGSNNSDIFVERTTFDAPTGILQQTEITRDNLAQSAIKTPLGVPVFWETGANPTTEWTTWFGTLKMAIMARDNLQVDKLLKLKPTREELFYPTLPTYEDALERETENEEREQRNERRKVDW